MTTVDPARDADERQVRLTEREALANVRTVLELCAAGELRCSDKTNRPAAATIRTVDAHLVHGDFYADERIATVAWPLLIQAGGLLGGRFPKCGTAFRGQLQSRAVQFGHRSATGISPCRQTRNCASAKL